MDGVEFDLSKVTAEEMEDFFKASRENDNKTLAKTLTLVIVTCPAAWGSPNDPKTFSKLPYFGVFKPLIKAFVNEANGKN